MHFVASQFVIQTDLDGGMAQQTGLLTPLSLGASRLVGGMDTPSEVTGEITLCLLGYKEPIDFGNGIHWNAVEHEYLV